MRTSLLLYILVLVPTMIRASEQAVTSRINEVKVFLSGAQVQRTAAVPLAIGSSTLVFKGLGEQLDPQSIQVSAKGGFSILSVNHRVNYLSESPKKKEVEELEKRFRALKHDIDVENNTLAVWNSEQELLTKNAAIGGHQNGITAAQLQAVNDYVRARMAAIRSGILQQTEKIGLLQEELQKVVDQMNTLRGEQPRPTSEVLVEVQALEALTATFTLGYFVPNAGWSAAYDLRATSVSKPIELLMKAEVVNNTGEDWNKVALSLSSGNPTLGGDMPQLQPWVIGQPMYPMLDMYQSSEAVRSQALLNAPAAEPAGNKMMEKDATYELANTVNYRSTTMEFVIQEPFSVPTDGAPHTVGVRTHQLPAQYKHIATPKLDRDAFLYARATGWEELDLLSGPANVFFEGTYVGRSFLALDEPKDTLDISLGRDKGVVLTRTKRKGFSDKPVIGGKRTVTMAWDIAVRNNKNSTVNLEVRDQFPISSRSEVEVDLKEREGASVDETKGQLVWNVQLEPKASKQLGFSYAVKHPKDEPIILE
jgi:uncharacterized protein (TIGR02231 family)